MTSNGRGEDLEATLNQGLHRHFRHKNANHFPPPPRQSNSSPSPPQRPPSPDVFSPESDDDDDDDDYMPILEGLMDGNTAAASRHRRQMSAAYRGVEYALSPTLKSPPIVFPRNPTPLSPQYYYQRPAYQPQTPVHDEVRLQSPSPLYNRTQAFRYSQQKHRPAPLRLQDDSPTLGHWTHHQQQQPLLPSPIPTPYSLDGPDNDSDDDEFPIRPSAALLPHKGHDGAPQPPAPRRRLPDLLQDVLEIMNSITSQQGQLEEESLALQDMVELVVTMQEQADSLMEYSDLVEEYVDVVNDEVTAAMAASPSSSAYSIDDTADVQDEEIEVGYDGPGEDLGGERDLASRADSGVSVGDDVVTDGEDARVVGSRRPRATTGVVSRAQGKVKNTPKEQPFRDSGLGLMSPDVVPPGNVGRGKPAASTRGRNNRSSGTRGRGSRLGGR